MVFDPALLPSGHQRLFTEAGITYEDSDDPPLAIAPREFDVPHATMWVRSHGEPMMLRDADGHWMLVFVGDNGSTPIESQPFWHLTDLSAAAGAMRACLDRHGLGLPDDLRRR